eukprot:3526725-Alexandrium_andersonii.AAC.1
MAAEGRWPEPWCMRWGSGHLLLAAMTTGSLERWAGSRSKSGTFTRTDSPSHSLAMLSRSLHVSMLSAHVHVAPKLVCASAWACECAFSHASTHLTTRANTQAC